MFLASCRFLSLYYLVLVIALSSPIASAISIEKCVIPIDCTLGQIVKVFVKFKNQKSSPIMIHAIKGSCSCLKVPPSRFEMAAGETTSVEVEYSNGKEVGIFRKQLLISSSEQEMPYTVTLLIRSRAN